LICLGKTGELKYSGFGKIAKCNSSFYTYFGVANKTETIRFEMGSSYLLCTDLRTQVVTHPLMGSLQQCGWNDVSFVVGANGQAGKNGLDGKDGIDGKTLWNGTKDPESSWGAPGDMYINSTTKTLFGPKGVDGTWPAGVSIVGPKGDQGPIGLTGAAGPQGPGGSGPAGATGATGPAGAAGADGVGSQNPVYFGTKGDTALLTTSSVAISLSLPAGSYLLTYSGIAFGINGQADEYVMCKIAAPATFAGTSVYVNGLSELNNRKYMVLQETITLTATETVSHGRPQRLRWTDRGAGALPMERQWPMGRWPRDR
jgi:hypothetical protein